MSPDRRDLLYGTLYPALHELQQAGWITANWTTSDSGRRVKVYALTGAGRWQLKAEEAAWAQATGIVARSMKIREETP
jgi:PadR family transcriptional regulator